MRLGRLKTRWEGGGGGWVVVLLRILGGGVPQFSKT